MADHTQLDADLAAYEQTEAGEAQQLATAQAANAALLQQNAQLQARAAQAPLRTAWGSSMAKGAAVLEAALGPLQIGRFYDNGQGLGAALTAAKKNGWPNRAGVFSFKSMTGFAAAVAQLTEQDYLCFDHEQDAKIAQGKLTVADFTAGWKAAHEQATAAGYRGRWVQIFTGFSLPQRIGQYVGDDYCDAVGIDPYTGDPTLTADQLVSPLIDTIRTVTQHPVGIAEIGCYYTDPAQRTAFVQTLGALAGRVAFCCWYSDSNAAHGDFSIDGIPEAASAYRTLVMSSAL